MYKALYAFKKTHPTSLGFEENEQFIELPGASGDKNWYYVVNGGGVAGYIPKNYVSKRDPLTIEEFKKFAEATKDNVKALKSLGNREKGELLAKIDRSRINFEKTLPTPAAYLVDVNNLPKPATSGSSSRSSTPPKSVKKRAAPKPPNSNRGSRDSMPDDVDAIQTVAEHNAKQVAQNTVKQVQKQ